MATHSGESNILDTEHRLQLNPYLRVLLEGVYDEQCALSYLRGIPNIVKEIWKHVKDFYETEMIIKPAKVNEEFSEPFIFSGKTGEVRSLFNNCSL